MNSLEDYWLSHLETMPRGIDEATKRRARLHFMSGAFAIMHYLQGDHTDEEISVFLKSAAKVLSDFYKAMADESNRQ